MTSYDQLCGGRDAHSIDIFSAVSCRIFLVQVFTKAFALFFFVYCVVFGGEGAAYSVQVRR